LRLALAAALALLTADILAAGAAWGPAAQAILIGVQVVTGACIAVGFVGRLASVGLIAPLALGAYADGLTPLGGVSLGLAIGILILGTGAASLWKPEETLLRTRAGGGGD
jgi:hypothetical protein